MLDKTFRTKKKEKKKSNQSQEERKKRKEKKKKSRSLEERRKRKEKSQKGPRSQLGTPAAAPEVGRAGGHEGAAAAEAAER